MERDVESNEDEHEAELIRLQVSSTSAIESTPTESDARRRIRPLPNALAHLHPSQDTAQYDRTKLDAFHSIAHCLALFDIWTFQTLFKPNVTIGRFISDKEETNEFKDHLVLGLAGLADAIGMAAFEAPFGTSPKFIACLNSFSDNQMVSYVRQTKTSGYYSELMQTWTAQYQFSKSNRTYVETTTTAELPAEFFLYSDWLAFVTSAVGIYRSKLRAIVRKCRALRNCIASAHDNGSLSASDMLVLKEKMEALDENFADVCAEIGEPAVHLIKPSALRWWEPEQQPEKTVMDEPTPATTFAAQNTTEPPNLALASTLLFIVPATCLLSCIPTAIAWIHTAPGPAPRPTLDPNFYQLLSSSALQLLSLLTLVWPLMFHAELARMSWVWTWVLAGTSACSTIAAVFFYVWLSMAWSWVLSFAGSVAQALVVLQVVRWI
ncbi:hypothetical protein BU16DRAFT_526278 [Lophium mytilinum]|uniref:Uncharacterized protein n=1 Tax=Lophium mytilinum TaxID=390894 RepID=A0A6A6R1F4_9PEZI|nr:hypothetical protein BU16DRAFT_526278 [Lophium mytilinum]